MDSGWIKLHRKIRDNSLWPKNRRFTPLEAWLDILLSANYAPTKDLHGTSTLIPVERGQFITSQVKLAETWGWNRKTVKGFLSVLQKEEMLDFESNRGADIGYTLITIRNYSEYQDKENDTRTLKRTLKRTSEGHWDGLQTDIETANNKKGKNVKKKNICSSSPGSTNGNGVSELTPEESFEVFYKAYPKRKSKGKAWKAWEKLKPRSELLKAMLDAIECAKKTEEWQKEKGQYIPYPASWLNARGWEDEIETQEVDPWEQYAG